MPKRPSMGDPPVDEIPFLDPGDEIWEEGEGPSEERTRLVVVGSGKRPPKPVVRVSLPNIHEAIAVTSMTIGTRDPLLYQRSHELVVVLGAEDPVDGQRAPIAKDTPVVRPLTAPALAPRLCRHVEFKTWKPPSDKAIMLAKQTQRSEPDGWVTCPPPPALVASMLAVGDWPGIRPLVGVTETPVMRPDGSIFQTSGYDEVTGYLYCPNADYPAVEETPSREAAMQALGELLDVFADFPYATPAHASVPIAAMLTVLARPAILGAVPAFLFDASTRGSGKTLQCDVVSVICQGRTAARANYPEKDEELEKTLAAYASAGARLILLDNVTRRLGGGPLDAVLTCRDEVEFRILGKTEIRRLPWRAVMMVSGNNLELGEDTTRRTLMARLESPLENPEERAGFAHPDLLRWAQSVRPRLIHAALTILRAYVYARNNNVAPARWGSFEEWSQLIPPAIVFAGGSDPLVTRATASAALSDTKRSLTTLIEGLRRLAPTHVPGEAVRPLTARHILDALYPEHDPHDGPRAPDGYEELRDSIEAETACPAGRKPAAQRLGKWLQRVRGRVIDGWAIERSEGPNHAACWRAVMASQ